MKNQILILVIVMVSLSSCSVLQKSNNVESIEGYHFIKEQGKKEWVYIDNIEDSMVVYATREVQKKAIVDTTKAHYVLPEVAKGAVKNNMTFGKTSFDLDFITIPVKLRLREGDVASQINSTLNGALYFGHRKDLYHVQYDDHPLGKNIRNIRHFGFSYGAFAGIGNTFMSPTNTRNLLDQEYDGIVLSYGVAGIVGINKFTVGVSFGFDRLLDENKKIWIYENRPWYGLTFGLNLN